MDIPIHLKHNSIDTEQRTYATPRFSDNQMTYVSFTNGNTKKNAQNMIHQINLENIRRDQLVSITMNETNVQDAD